MADDSPGKVQALRAIFSEKDKPLMGMIPPPNRFTNKPWRSTISSTETLVSIKDRSSTNDHILPSQVMTKVLSHSVKRVTVSDTNGVSDKLPNKLSKPVIGPKPAHLLQQGRTSSSSTINSLSSDASDDKNINETVNNKNLCDSTKFDTSHTKSNNDTFASFMFINGTNSEKNLTDSIKESLNYDSDNNVQPSLIKLKNISLHSNSLSQIEFRNKCNNIQTNDKVPKYDIKSYNGLINSDNYICKSNCSFRRKELPPIDKLGPAPLKPIKPSHLKLPDKWNIIHFNSTSSSVKNSQPIQKMPTTITSRSIPQRPSYPCPPRPLTSPPLPPTTISTTYHTETRTKSPPLTLREEIEELYEDTILSENKRPISLIPEYTEEEENGEIDLEELYHDAADDSSCFFASGPIKPKDPPPPRPSEYLQPKVHGSLEELYQDAEEANQEEFYEEMPMEMASEEPGTPLYTNNRKEIEKLRREEEKRLRKEQKEREKREKEMEKLRKKFGLTGEEIPIDKGLVKADSRSGKGDLIVKKGETVLILRMEGNPSGRWLVKNEKGKIGYVELTNIEVDPDSVKTVMISRRQSVISACEELYSEAASEEAIYEETY